MSRSNLAELAENALGRSRTGGLSLARFGDVSLGYARKDVHVLLAPAWITPDREARGTNADIGALARVSPWAIVEEMVPRLKWVREDICHLDIDVAYGRSRQNRDDEFLEFVEGGYPSPMGRLDRDSWPGALPWASRPHCSGSANARAWRGWPAVSILEVGYVEDRVTPSVPRPDEARLEGRHIDGHGTEVTFANVLSLRWGHIDDVEGTIDDEDIVDDTSGWGIRLPISDYASVQWDRATVPQSWFLDERVTRKGFLVRIDALRILEELRRER